MGLLPLRLTGVGALTLYIEKIPRYLYKRLNVIESLDLWLKKHRLDNSNNEPTKNI